MQFLPHHRALFGSLTKSSVPTLQAPSSPPSLIQASDVSNFLSGVTQQCPTDVYVFVSQPGVIAKDFISKDSAPHLRRLLTTANETSEFRTSYSDVVGNVDLSTLLKTVTGKCGATSVNVDQASS